MRGAWTGCCMVLVLALGAVPAAAMPARKNVKPRILSAVVVDDGTAADRRVRVAVVARDRDDVVRGAEISWGEGQPGQGLSACRLSSSGDPERRRRGRRARFELSHAYSQPGDYAITVSVTSGGCGKRPEQRSAPRTLTVHVD